jgi:hypothetical protein
MPFQYTLANLVADNEGTIGVLFLDETGETVDLACAEFTPFEMKIVGAYLGIYLRQLGILAESKVIGPAELLHIEKEEIHLFAAPLADGYYLALIQRRPAVVARTLRSLRAARDEIVREIFS